MAALSQFSRKLDFFSSSRIFSQLPLDNCHCEERSDEAISVIFGDALELRRLAKNIG